MLNLALLGTGRIADSQLAPALAKTSGVQSWSVLSRDVDRAGDFAARHGAQSTTPAYESLEALPDDPRLHGVIIATPDRLHASQAITAARAGKHVFIEKLMVASAEAARLCGSGCREQTARGGWERRTAERGGAREDRVFVVRAE